MSLKNKITEKIQSLLAKKTSPNLLGISLRQKSLSFCLMPLKSDIQTDSVNTPERQYLEACKALAMEHNLAGQVSLVLSPQQTQIVQIDKPTVPDEEMVSALKWQIKDLVSVAPEDMLLDYFEAPKLSGVEKLNVVCASFSEVKTIVEPLSQGPFKLNEIISEEFAFANLIPISSDATLLVCQQPNEEVVIVIVKEGRIFFHRRLRGFAHLADKTEAELGMGVVDSLSLEIQRSTDYFERQLKQAPIKSIAVLLPIKNESFLARKLSENSNVAVNLLAMPEGFSEQREHAAAIGAVIVKKQMTELIEETVTAKEEVNAVKPEKDEGVAHG